jgi:hypothetical protein
VISHVVGLGYFVAKYDETTRVHGRLTDYTTIPLSGSTVVLTFLTEPVHSFVYPQHLDCVLRHPQASSRVSSSILQGTSRTPRLSHLVPWPSPPSAALLIYKGDYQILILCCALANRRQLTAANNPWTWLSSRQFKNVPCRLSHHLQYEIKRLSAYIHRRREVAGQRALNYPTRSPPQ